MKKSVIIRLSKIALSIYFLSVLFYSCSENNPVKNNPIDSLFIDSNFFNWEYHEINGIFISSFFIADTNTVFISGYPRGILYDNGSYNNISYNDPDFYDSGVFGNDRNYVLFAGNSSHNTGYKSKIKKWSGSGIGDIILPDYPSGAVTHILINSIEDLWISTSESYIYHYQNGAINIFKIDSTYTSIFIIKNETNEYRAFSMKYLNDSNNTRVARVYLFGNNGWLSESSDTITTNTELQMYGSPIGNTVIRYGKSGLYKYQGNTWIKFLDYYDFNPACNGGEQLSNFIAYDNSYSSHSRKIYLYHKNTFYRQTNHYTPEGSSIVCNIQNKFNRFYILYLEDFGPFTNFSIATPIVNTNIHQ